MQAAVIVVDAVFSLTAICVLVWALVAQPFGEDSVGRLLIWILPFAYAAVGLGLGWLIYLNLRKNRLEHPFGR